MENNYLKIRPKSVFGSKNSVWVASFILVFLMLFAHMSTYAQVPCSPRLAMTITTFDASDSNTANAKVKVSGVQNGASRVGLSVGNSYTGPAFAGAKVVSSLVNGIVDSTLQTPSTAPGRQYTLRVFSSDGSCYSDSTFYLPYVNYNYTPQYVDIEATITRSPAGDVPLGDTVSVTIAVRNAGSLEATNVKFTIAYAAGLALDSNIPSVGTYNDGTKIWDIGTIVAGGTHNLVLKFVVGSRGIKEVTAQNSSLDQVDLDSSPIANLEVEDDEGQICISTHRDWCPGDEYTFTLANGIYTDVVWQRSTDNGATWSTITGTNTFADVTGSGLVIKEIGDYKYYKNASSGSCGFEGCCPIKVIPGLPPILSTPNNEVICFGQLAPVIRSNNTQAGYTATSNDTYGIQDELPPFLADQGNFDYQWFNNNGPSNPTLDSLKGQDSLRLTALPTAPGIYHYRLISVQNGHTSCRDTTQVTFTINELPIPVASSNSPVCAEGTINLEAHNTEPNNPINPYPSPLTWGWTGPGGWTFADSTTTRTNATESMEGQYVVRASYTLHGLECANTDTLQVIVNPLPDRPNAIDTAYCQFITPKRLSALLSSPVIDHNGDSLRWWHGPTAPGIGVLPDTTSPIGRNVGPMASTLTVSQDLWFVAQIDANKCQSHLDTVRIDIWDQPDKPTVQDVAYCENYPSNPLTATTSGGSFSLIWYGLNKTNIPGDTSATYAAPPTNVVDTLTYWVSQFDNTHNCQSDTAHFDVIIKDTPIQPNAADPVYCLNAAATPFNAGILQVPNDYLTWYWLTDSLANPATPPTPLTTVAGATWGYVTQTKLYLDPQGNTMRCESPREPFLVTVNPLPVATLIPVSALCVGTLSQNNGMLVLNRFRDNDIAAWNLGGTFNSGSATVVNPIPSHGILVSNLPNPSGPSDNYTVRVTNEFGCIIDVTEPLIAKDCTCPGGYCEPATVTKTK